tara:strand:+ start:76 stop:321 length:246 start_codon:yes stop_codon:yes gene_type:complete
MEDSTWARGRAFTFVNIEIMDRPGNWWQPFKGNNMRIFIFSMSIILPIMVLGCKKDVKDLPDSRYLEPDPGPCKASIPRYY